MDSQTLPPRSRASKEQFPQHGEVFRGQDKIVIFKLLKKLAPDMRAHNRFGELDGNFQDLFDKLVDFSTKYIQEIRNNSYDASLRSKVFLEIGLLLNSVDTYDLPNTLSLQRACQHCLDSLTEIFHGSEHVEQPASHFLSEKIGMVQSLNRLINMYQGQDHSNSKDRTLFMVSVLDAVKTTSIEHMDRNNQREYLFQLSHLLNQFTWQGSDQSFLALRLYTLVESYEYSSEVSSQWVLMRDELISLMERFNLNTSDLPITKSRFSAIDAHKVIQFPSAENKPIVFIA